MTQRQQSNYRQGPQQAKQEKMFRNDCNLSGLVCPSTRIPEGFEFKHLASGSARLRINLLIKEDYTPRGTDDVKTRDLYVDVVCWGKKAEEVVTFLRKNLPIKIYGGYNKRVQKNEDPNIPSRVFHEFVARTVEDNSASSRNAGFEQKQTQGQPYQQQQGYQQQPQQQNYQQGAPQQQGFYQPQQQSFRQPQQQQNQYGNGPSGPQGNYQAPAPVSNHAPAPGNPVGDDDNIPF